MLRSSGGLLNQLENLKNRNLAYKEFELIDEIEKLKMNLTQLSKRGGNFVEGENTEETRLNNIKYMIHKYQEKISVMDMKFSSSSNHKHAEKILSYDKQIEFHANKEVELKEKMKQIDNTIDYDKLKSKLVKDKNELKEKQAEKEDKMNKDGEDGVNRVVNVEEQFDRVNSELQIQKYNMLNEHLKSQEENKKEEKKRKVLLEQLGIFNKVKEETKKINEKNKEKARNDDIDLTMKKVDQEIKNFDINLLKNTDKIKTDNDSILISLTKSFENIKNLDEKMTALNVDKSNETCKNIINIYNSNSNLAKQNNIIMQNIVGYSKDFYEKVFEKLIKNENIDNFMKVKERIDEFKAECGKEGREDEKMEGDKEYDSDDYI